MAEAAKVRLVRCPKCENLLTELPDFSLYQCGGCGAVLEAKHKGVLEDGLPAKSDAVNNGEISEKNSTTKASDVKMESADNIGVGLLDKTRKEATPSDVISTSRPERTHAPTDSNLPRRGKERNKKQETLDNGCASYSQGLNRNRNAPDNRGSNVDVRSDYVNFHGEQVKDTRPPTEPLRSRPVMDQWGVETNGPGRGPAPTRFDGFRYYDEGGQSSYEMNSYCEQAERTSRYQGPNSEGLARTENLENGREELIRRLDELKDQISRSCDISDKSKERMVSSTSSDPYGRRQAAYNYQEILNKRPLPPDDVGPPYCPDPRGYAPYTADRFNPHALVGLYPERRYPHEFTHYPNAYNSDIIRRPYSGPQSQYARHHPYHEPLPGYYGDANHELFMLHRPENFFHQPACSCAHCCDKNWHTPPKVVDPRGLHNRRFRNEPSNPDHRNLNPLPPRKLLSLNSNDPDFENEGLNYHRPRKFFVPNRSGRVSHPILGGAPFVACSNCFEVLKLSRKRILSGEDVHKFKCGACSSIISFEFGNKGFIASASAKVDQIPTELDEGSSGTLDENLRYWNDRSNSANLNALSNGYGDFHDDFNQTGKKSGSVESEKHLARHSSSSSLSQDERSPENGIHDLTESVNPDMSADESIAVNRFDKRNKSQRPEQDRIPLDRNKSRPISVRDAGVATEMDVSLNDFSNSCASHDSVEILKEAKPKVNRGGESFFTGLIKKSFKDSKKSNQGGGGGVEVGGGSQVFVNGHFLSDRVVKKAEKLAGPIQPGEYWYDKRAGFWGVMGHPCLGIILPNIEEFNYPLPENCAAGNTGVYVNGRELHQKDLDLLASRGLPITKNRSYFVEITGKVIDEQTGEELDGLGKLAPTVERSKHGFGMKVPGFLARSQN